MSGRNGLITHSGTRRHTRPAQTCACSIAPPISNPCRTAATCPISPCPDAHTFEAGHIPGADFLDLQGEFSDQSTELRFMMPAWRNSKRRSAATASATTAGSCSTSIGTPMWATRFWWMLKSLGFENVAVLDGGLDKWKARRPRARDRAGEGISAGDIHRKTARGIFRRQERVLAASGERDTVVVNALGAQFHKGLEPSRYGRPGHIPGSCNVSAATLVDPADQGLRPARGSRSEIRGAGHFHATSAWSPIAAAASRPPSICSCCTGSATTSSRSMTARWANGPRISRCRSRRVEFALPVLRGVEAMELRNLGATAFACFACAPAMTFRSEALTPARSDPARPSDPACSPDKAPR